MYINVILIQEIKKIKQISRPEYENSQSPLLQVRASADTEDLGRSEAKLYLINYRRRRSLLCSLEMLDPRFRPGFRTRRVL